MPTGHGDGLEIRLPESKLRAMRVAQAKFRRAVRVVGRYDEIEVGGHVRPRILLHYINRETSERTDLKTKGIPAAIMSVPARLVQSAVFEPREVEIMQHRRPPRTGQLAGHVVPLEDTRISWEGAFVRLSPSRAPGR